MKARIKITLKTGVLDPQGKAIQNALASLGFTGVNDVRQGKYIEVDLAESQRGQGARAGREDMQRASRQHGDRELRLRAGAVTAAIIVAEQRSGSSPSLGLALMAAARRLAGRSPSRRRRPRHSRATSSATA